VIKRFICKLYAIYIYYHLQNKCNRMFGYVQYQSNFVRDKCNNKMYTMKYQQSEDNNYCITYYARAIKLIYLS